MLRRCFFSCLLFGASAAPLLAQGTPSLVRDIATGSETSLLQGDGPALLIGTTTFFAGFTQTCGSELWKTDGTSAGTSLVLDIAPGSFSSAPDQFVALGGVLYFAARTQELGRELWRSDGTTGGTYRVRDIYTGEESSSPSQLTLVNNLIFFSAIHPTYGRELWYSDGTSGGTALAFDVRPGTTGSMTTSSEIVWGVRVISGVPFALALFAADDGVHGIELWEGSNSGAALRADIRPGSASSSPQGFVSSGGHVMFSAESSTVGREPYVTRDTGATLAGDVNPGVLGSSPRDFVVGNFGGTVKFYFSAFSQAYGRELWEHDTSSGGTTLIEDVYAGSTGSDPVPFVAGNTVLFSAELPSSGRELWKTDGTARGTAQVRNWTIRGAGDPQGFLTLSTSPLRVLFAANDGSNGIELWMTDATSVGTTLVRDISLTGSSIPRLWARAAGGRALLTAFPDGLISYWYRTDGTNGGTALLLPGATGSASSRPYGFLGSAPSAPTWFAADDGTSGTEPYASDGTSAGTLSLGDLNAGTLSSLAVYQEHAELGSLTVFRGTVTGLGAELCVTDGTPSGTGLLADLNPGSATSSLSELTAMDGYALFFATTPIYGNELWRTDGTTAGTTLVKDIVPGAGSYNGNSFAISEIVRLGSRAYFFAFSAAEGFELWSSDGTTAGTQLVKDIRPGVGNSIPQLSGVRFAASETHVFFAADDGTNGLELWRSNGTTAGTQLVANLSGGSASTAFQELLWHGGLLYCIATTPAAGGLFSTTTSGATAALVRSFPALETDFVGASSLTSLGTRLLFAGYSSASGWEPWISDGTNGGTQLLRDVFPGAESGLKSRSAGSYFFHDGEFFVPPGSDIALFPGARSANGFEVWRTNGTTVGTSLHAEIEPGPHGSDPQGFAFAGDRVWFSAFTSATGVEPFAMDPPAMSLAYAYGCPGTAGLVPRLRALNPPYLGNRSFTLALEGARPSTAVTWNVGFGPWNIPVGGGCNLLVDLVLPYAPFTATTDLRGEAQLVLPLPDDPLLQGLNFYTQVLALDPNGAFANLLAFSGGWRAIVQPR